MQAALDERLDANLADCILDGVSNDLFVLDLVLIER